ncbi:head GIN domain-containing protein [Lishizhenia sp.]|uniref:head GIN domain-containing protein n=1 Tax=Lishizhenia sp. TaxID=2497594 RepID=UPI00299F4624|nr:head GIN domain-containing protein [Lishizhenia sp.]MDX1446697.1 head GIN domain-containing protein [Lishizhenia sp.]
MKLLSLFALLSLGFGLQAQTKKLTDFSELKISGRMEATLYASDSNYLEVLNKGKDVDLEKLELIYKGDELVIKYLGSTLMKKDIKLAIYTKGLQQISANQGATITSDDSLIHKGEKLNLEVFAGGTIDVSVSTKWIEANINQGGSISLKGNTDYLDLSIATGGYIAASFLAAKKIKAEIKFGGEIICHPTEYLDAKIVSGGVINYKGNPEVKKKIKLGGKVIQL